MQVPRGIVSTIHYLIRNLTAERLSTRPAKYFYFIDNDVREVI